ncbi:hypothetical protein [Armatimonas sp.]|uniref:hypothetical protein n=1 Tax=Armatimonas sp. TaxID=1872638 RepID=UPI00374CB2B7
MEKISLPEKLAQIHEHWRPKVIAELNGQEVKLVKFCGVFPWHHHENEDEHRTLAESEAEVLLFEPAATRNTGNVQDAAFTAPNGVKL